jgi:carbamoyl-phosphate synthase large subunit
MSARPVILILGASAEMLPLMELARSDGYLVAATDRNPDAPGLHFADFPYPGDVSAGNTLEQLADALRPAGILTRVELLLPHLARVCRQFNLPGPSEAVAAMSVDKHLFRETMMKAGLQTPRFREMTANTTIGKALEYTGLPAILKPVDYSGSTGVVLVRDLSEAQNALDSARKVSPSGRVIVEQYLVGREFSVETWSYGRTTHIAAITEKGVSNNGHFVEIQHVIQARLNDQEKTLIEAEVQKMAKVMELDHCLTHTEVMLTQEGAVLIETGARPGGDLIGLTLVERATGISMNRIMLNLALGKPIPAMPAIQAAAAIQYVTSQNVSVVQTIHDTLLKDPNFAGYEKLRDDDPEKLESSADRLAYYLFQSDHIQSLQNTLALFDE